MNFPSTKRNGTHDAIGRLAATLLTGLTASLWGIVQPAIAAAYETDAWITDAGVALKLEHGIAPDVSNTGWITVSLPRDFDQMVIVTSPVYEADDPPRVIRVREAGPASFQLRADRLDGDADALAPSAVHYLVVEAGAYTVQTHGIAMEAVRYESTLVSRADLWAGEPRSYAGTYDAPVVIGQVMSYNDPRASVFFSFGKKLSSPPDAGTLVVGRHTGQDPDTARLPETVGYLVFETGAYDLSGLRLEAAVGSDSVRGISAPPASYALGGMESPTTAVVSRAGVDGKDGGWAMLLDPAPLTPDSLTLAIDEDQLADAERGHTTEQVAYLVAGGVQGVATGCGGGLPAASQRDDVLVLYNRNSRSSCEVAEYYADARGLGRDSLLEVAVPDAYFIGWDDFLSLRDQILAHMVTRIAADTGVVIPVCTETGAGYFCEAAMSQVRALTGFRYLVTTRGIPTRVTVDDSSLGWASATSVDNYLRHWLVNHFHEDAAFEFPQRAVAFGDGRGMRPVEPATDRELIVGRIDGLTVAAVNALVDRTLAAEAGGLHGVLYGSKFLESGAVASWNRWDPEDVPEIYGTPENGWRVQLGRFGESRPECLEYLDHPAGTPEGKAPEHCRARMTDGTDQGPSHAQGRQPTVAEAAVYLGSKDNSRSATGNFADLLKWKRDPACAVALCEDAADPAACRAASADPFQEINTACVGVADGFVGFNMQSYPLSYLTAWPTGWRGPGGGSYQDLAFPEVRTDTGYDDAYSLWFRNSDEIDDPMCYAGADYAGEPDIPCVSRRRIFIRQILGLPGQVVDLVSPQQFRIEFRYAPEQLAAPAQLRVRLRVANDSGEVVYSPVIAGTADPAATGWQAAQATFTLDPARHSGEMAVFDQLTVELESDTFGGALGIDSVTVADLAGGENLAVNGDFTQGHRSLSDGDYAATFLSRLNGVGFWGSLSHHESAGYSFTTHPVTTLVYFLRGLPLGDAVWFAEFHNSGILYGDPLYSPVAVRLDYHNDYDYVTGAVEIGGSAINGRDPERVDTAYAIDFCPGDDFFVCDQADAWQPTGVTGVGGTGLLGTWSTDGLARGVYTLRLAVTSENLATGKSGTLFDHQVVTVYEADADQDSDGLTDYEEVSVYDLDPTVADMDGDGLGDGDEIALGLDPRDPDGDDDGMPDGFEVGYGLDPFQDDALEDPDGDYLSNLEEYGYGTNPTDRDTDGDGLMDWLELVRLGTDPTLWDSDADGLSDLAELKDTHTSPVDADSDDDAMSDGWEWIHGLDPLTADSDGDPDADGVINVLEFLRATDPQDPGSWPDLATWHVDASAAAGGDGSAALPFQRLQEALAAAAEGDTIRLRAGRYLAGEPLVIDNGLRLAGDEPGVVIEATGVLVMDSPWGGFDQLGIETGTSVIFRTTRNWTVSNGTLASGYGIVAQDDARLELRQAGLVTRGAATGLTIASQSQVTMINVTVADFGYGVVLDGDGSTLTARNAIFANGQDLVGDLANADIRYSLLGDGQLQGVDGNLAGTASFRQEWWGDFRLQPGSAGIDAGDTADDYSGEPEPNGCRINMGQFGNTALAASSGVCAN